jgi:hypothetical protein
VPVPHIQYWESKETLLKDSFHQKFSIMGTASRLKIKKRNKNLDMGSNYPFYNLSNYTIFTLLAL